MGQDLGFTLEVDFGVDVGRVNGDVAEPGTNGVDVDAGAQQMRCRGVSDGVRADGPFEQRWMGSRSRPNMVAQHPVDTVSGDGLSESVQEDRFIG